TPSLTHSPTLTLTPCPCGNYLFATGTATIVPGTTDIGNHTDDGGTLISLPFPVNLYGAGFSSVTAGSNGYLSFGVFVNNFYSGCIPASSTGFSYTIYPWEVDQITTPTGYGIFTLTTGTSPNRI